MNQDDNQNSGDDSPAADATTTPQDPVVKPVDPVAQGTSSVSEPNADVVPVTTVTDKPADTTPTADPVASAAIPAVENKTGGGDTTGGTTPPATPTA